MRYIRWPTRHKTNGPATPNKIRAPSAGYKFQFGRRFFEEFSEPQSLSFHFDLFGQRPRFPGFDFPFDYDFDDDFGDCLPPVEIRFESANSLRRRVAIVTATIVRIEFDNRSA